LAPEEADPPAEIGYLPALECRRHNG